jgi:hypothetical protein
VSNICCHDARTLGFRTCRPSLLRNGKFWAASSDTKSRQTKLPFKISVSYNAKACSLLGYTDVSGQDAAPIFIVNILGGDQPRRKFRVKIKRFRHRLHQQRKKNREHGNTDRLRNVRLLIQIDYADFTRTCNNSPSRSMRKRSIWEKRTPEWNAISIHV